MTTIPLVSCIMPTANRAQFIPLAMKYFARQDYPNLELIVLDDGDPVRHLIPDDPRIKYARPGEQLTTVGAKRNYANRLANGEILMHLDDDDWYAADWVTKQTDTLLTTDADICGLSELFFYSPSTDKSWKYIYPTDERPWVAGATMAYRKAFWEQHPFHNAQVGEDNQFVWFSGGKVATNTYIDGFVSIIHPANTSPKHINTSRWVKCEPGQVRGVLGMDALLY